MAKWLYTVDIKPIIERDRLNETDEHAVTVSHEIAALLRERLPPAWFDGKTLLLPNSRWDSELVGLVEEMEQVSVGCFDDDGDDDYTVLKDLNINLARLYDWADGRRVWLGL